VQNESLAEDRNRKFGQYLRKIREERKLSLDSVEEMTVGYPERITKSHLSRIENGQASPTFPRMFALSQIYGVPIGSLAERFEIDLQRQMIPPDLHGKSNEEVAHDIKLLRKAGRYAEALQHVDALLDRGLTTPPEDDAERRRGIDLRLERVTCLFHLAKHASAKEECEDMLGRPEMTPEQRVLAFLYLIETCHRLNKFTVALITLERTEKELRQIPKARSLHARFGIVKGNLMANSGRLADAIDTYKNTLSDFEGLGDAFEACRTRLNLAETLLESGRLGEARRHLTIVMEQAKNGGFDRQMAHALSTLALLHYRRGEKDAAESYCLKSNTIARPREYHSVVFRNCYYLWKMATERRDAASIRANERTLRAYLGRVEDFLPEAVAYREFVAGGAS
jgi:transcriptional regulator with XRE-family HTH domain